MSVEARRIRFKKEPIRKAMQKKGADIFDLAELIGRTESSIKNAFQEELILPEHLLKITNYLGISYHDVALTNDDFEPIIRCKDCKYYSYGTIEGKHLCMSVKYRFMPTTEDEWCSRAEMKEDDKTD